MIRVFCCHNLINIILQNVSLKPNVFAKRKKKLPPLLKRPNVRQRRKQLFYANSAKKNEPLLQNKHVFVCNAKKKQRSAENNARRKSGLLPEILW